MSVSLEQALIYKLLNTGAVTAKTSTRIYPEGESPTTDARPRLTLQRISTKPTPHQGGNSNLWRVRIQINCWATTQLAAIDLADLVVAALDNISGAQGETGSTVTVVTCLLDSRYNLPEPPGGGGQGSIYRTVLDWLIDHR